ncbi:hypothetical protein OKW50_008265 [Paraburkholderia youngii]|uniref:sulfotransferase n=1 Tax=Paraburkholderia youngii TaxID=2782701 RepID=UPI003D2126B6
MPGFAIPCVSNCPPFTLPSNPVLLGGENRSGTTLLSVLLDSHCDLVVGPELDFTEPVDLGPHILAVCDMIDVHDSRLAGATKDTVDPDWYDGAHFVLQCERFGLERDDLRNLVVDLMTKRGTDLSALEDRCRLIDSIGEFRRKQMGARRWGMKLQRRILDVGTYAAIWPRAHFIHIIRDGRDLAASHLKTVPEWGYRTVAQAAHGWLDVVTGPRQAAPDGRYLEAAVRGSGHAPPRNHQTNAGLPSPAVGRGGPEPRGARTRAVQQTLGASRRAGRKQASAHRA